MNSSHTTTQHEVIDEKTPPINKAILDTGKSHQLTEEQVSTQLRDIYNAQKQNKHIGGNALDSKKRTPLINAARLGNVEAITWLLNPKEHTGNTAAISHLDEEKMSALAHAVSYADPIENNATDKDILRRRAIIDKLIEAGRTKVIGKYVSEQLEISDNIIVQAIRADNYYLFEKINQHNNKTTNKSLFYLKQIKIELVLKYGSKEFIEYFCEKYLIPRLGVEKLAEEIINLAEKTIPPEKITETMKTLKNISGLNKAFFTTVMKKPNIPTSILQTSLSLTDEKTMIAELKTASDFKKVMSIEDTSSTYLSKLTQNKNSSIEAHVLFGNKDLFIEYASRYRIDVQKLSALATTKMEKENSQDKELIKNYLDVIFYFQHPNPVNEQKLLQLFNQIKNPEKIAQILSTQYHPLNTAAKIFWHTLNNSSKPKDQDFKATSNFSVNIAIFSFP